MQVRKYDLPLTWYYAKWKLFDLQNLIFPRFYHSTWKHQI